MVALDNFVKNPTNQLGQLKLTIAQFFRITGNSTQFRGVIPDFVLPETYYRPNQREWTNKSAMPWSEIKPIPFVEYDQNMRLGEEQWSNLQMKHDTRIRNNPIFRYLTKKIEFDAKLAQKNIFSLDESRRYTERDSHENNINELKNILLGQDKTVTPGSLDKIDFPEEAILVESAKILTDIIFLTSDRSD